MSGIRNLLAQKPYHKARLDIVANPITTAAWVQVLASTPKACTALMVSYTGESILKVSTGATADEDNHIMDFYIAPGMDQVMIPVEIAKGKKLSVEALDQNTALGELVMNFFG